MTYQNDNVLVCHVFVIFANFKLFKSIQKKSFQVWRQAKVMT